MTFDEKVFNLKQEMVQAINKYQIPASVVMLICEGISKDVSIQIQRSDKEVNTDDNNDNKDI